MSIIRSANDNGEQYVDATETLNGLRRDLRRLKRAVRINTVLLMIILLLTVILPTTEVLLRP
jgi:hypothetical protein